jgi:tetratricopeptide (TPR) repeat protein
MFDWLDGDGWATRWRRGSGSRVLEVAVDNDGADIARAVLELPWELLADRQGFLAADQTQPLVVVRSLGRRADDEVVQPDHRDLAVMFMAASPEGQRVLDFEAEESAILEATERLAVQVVVEESGCGELLKDRIGGEGAFEVVHVSCHGAILDGVPKLALETVAGELDLVSPGDFAVVLGEHKPLLVFVSACQTAESGSEFAEPFVRALVRSGVPNVLGWDGSVYDTDATRFARTFYGDLAGHASVPFAASAARRDLLLAHLQDPRVGRHWHLARVYTGSGGGGACCGRDRPGRRVRRDAGYKEFLDKAARRVPVASAREFVGRRRQAQAVLRSFRDSQAGVLIFGMGNLGKSSLAARIANRMVRHRTVVVFERYDALAVFEQLLAAVPAGERAGWERTWREQIAADAGALGRALEELLEGPFFDRPILLVIDDFEQVLEAPSPGQMRTPVADAPGTVDVWRAALSGVLRAFTAADIDSRLLLTSRYDFTLADGRGRDLTDGLNRVALTPMDGDERAKQWRAAARALNRRGAEHDADSERRLVARAQTEAGGNPGLQEILCRPILSGELDVAREALDTVERWKRSGEVPEDDNAAQEFFRRVSFRTYQDALTASELKQLRAATVFSESLPVPVAALHAAGSALGVGDPAACLRRLVGLGLVDDWTTTLADGSAHGAVNALARPLAGALREAEVERLAGAAIDAIAVAWRDDDGDFPSDMRGVEAARLAVAGNAAAELLDRTAYAAGTFLFRRQDDARSALELLRAALGKIEGHAGSPRPQFLRLASDCAERIGENDLCISLLEQALSLTSGDAIELALAAVQHASATVTRDGPERALATLSEAADVLKEAGEHRSRAVTMGQIADILQQRGETDEALRIRQEEQLPVYERLGDVRERAVTMGKIADILQHRGETDEALRIHVEDRLPVAQRMQDQHSLAHIRLCCAQIRLSRGGLQQGEGQLIYDELAESFMLFQRLQRVDGLALAGALLGQVLAAAGAQGDATSVLEVSAAAFDRMGHNEQAAQIRALAASISKEH